MKDMNLVLMWFIPIGLFMAVCLGILTIFALVHEARYQDQQTRKQQYEKKMLETMQREEQWQRELDESDPIKDWEEYQRKQGNQ